MEIIKREDNIIITQKHAISVNDRYYIKSSEFTGNEDTQN